MPHKSNDKIQPLISTTNQVEQLFAPLKNQYDLHYFRFVRVYDDGKMIVLGNLPEWTEHYYQQQYYQTCVFDQPTQAISAGQYLWDFLPENSGDEILATAQESFQFGQGMSLVNIHQGYHDLFEFAGGRHNLQANRHYVGGRDNFNHFSNQFIEQGQALIEQQLQNPLYITKTEGSEFYDLNNGPLIEHSQPIKSNHALHHNNKTVYLTQRELGVLALLSIGYSTKACANFLNLSARTVETYIHRIKIKTNIKTKMQLLRFAHHNHLAIYAYQFIKHHQNHKR